MPVVLRKARRADAFAFIRPKAILASLICSLLVFALLLWRFQAGHHTSSRGAVVASLTPAPPCSAPNQAFCPTQTKFLQYVANNDFSDILEQQTPVLSNEDGVSIRRFDVMDGGLHKQLNRNDYISFFRNYTATSGPLRFQGDTSSDNNAITMHFAGTKPSNTYNLGFVLADNQWQLQTPTVNY